MKRLEKLMAYDELVEYLKTHLKYSLPTLPFEYSPYTGVLTEEDEFRFVNSTDEKSHSKLVKFPVYLEYSKAYQIDLKTMQTHFDPMVREFASTYL